MNLRINLRVWNKKSTLVGVRKTREKGSERQFLDIIERLYNQCLLKTRQNIYYIYDHIVTLVGS